CLCFFFQAEDGIRDLIVTGVQTCALPISCYLGGVRAPKLALLDAEVATELAIKDLRTILGVKGQPTFRHHFLFSKAIPQYEVGFGRFKDLMNQLESNAPGLFLAGHYRDGISLGDSIVSGHGVAERIAN